MGGLRLDHRGRLVGERQLRLLKILILAEIDVIARRLIEMAGEIIFGDQRGGCMSFDRLDGPRMLLGLMAFKRQLVFKRHVDRAVEIGVERLFARGLHG
ncbi:hypothetical protein, partial [Mesorhizobium sp.]|uniref:hypothetical protein n=1 Tax=Mesorhizobium sp. TaxID=1871066 RepID=UPI0025D82FC3